MLQPAGAALLEQLALYRRLIGLEWQAERGRLLQLLLAAAVVFAGALGLLLGAGALLVALCWATPYRNAAVVAVLALYAMGATLGWRSLRAIAARGEHSFAVTRAELAADLELLRSRL